MSARVSDSDSRENTPFSVSTGTNLNWSRVNSPLPPAVITVLLTSATRPANTRLASPNVGSKSRSRNHSSRATDFTGQARITNRRQIQTIGRASRFTGRYLAFMTTSFDRARSDSRSTPLTPRSPNFPPWEFGNERCLQDLLGVGTESATGEEYIAHRDRGGYLERRSLRSA